MEKNLVDLFKSQYVRIIKDNREILDGTIIEILEDSVIFQTELGRTAFSINSIREIIPYDEINKRKRLRSGLKSNQY
ncbi:MAG: hypothetical protein MUO82_04305 [Candidatus Thermoplasmatota archaeon]|nr:hypothetical protein [Candidatus Thermoplasmatota archaeon]